MRNAMKKTSLYENHIELNAKIIDFAGYGMPISYPKGINNECHSVRNKAGVFDVSHMGQILIEGDNCFDFVQRLTTNDVSKIDIGQCQYTAMCNEAGGIIDDLILYKLESGFLFVVNASNIEKDYNWILKNNNKQNRILNLSDKISLIALQGPDSRKILSNFSDFKNIISKLDFYQFSNFSNSNDISIISRTGYTGELGFEIYGSHRYIKKLWEDLIDRYEVKPIGLAARDILRLEMCYRLYGNDMDDNINPYECGLGWIVDKAGGFIGDANVKPSIDKKLIALCVNDKGIPRRGYKICNLKEEIGYVSSGTFSPTLNKGIALGYVESKSNIDDIFIKVRDRLLSSSIIKGPFIKESSLFD